MARATSMMTDSLKPWQGWRSADFQGSGSLQWPVEPRPRAAAPNASVSGLPLWC